MLKDSKASNTQKEQVQKLLRTEFKLFTGMPTGQNSKIQTEHAIRLKPDANPHIEWMRWMSPEQEVEVNCQVSHILGSWTD